MKRSGTSIIAASAALLLAVGLTAGPGTATADAAGTRHVSRAQRQHANAVLGKVRSVLAAHPARGTRTAPVLDTDYTLLLRQLRSALPALSSSDRTTAKRILARPTDSGGDCLDLGDGNCTNVDLGQDQGATISTYATTHFVIHYQSNPGLAADQRPPSTAWVQTVGDTLEHVYSTEVTGMGYRAPLSDGSEPSVGTASNPDGKFDVFLANIGVHGLYGYTSWDSQASTGKQPPYLVLDNDYVEFPATPVHSLDVTVAHEFFHAIQFAYNVAQETWLMEGTAVWMEDQVYPTINDYLQYLKASTIPFPGQSIDVDAYPWHYGAVVFWKYLSESLHDPSVIRQVWNYSDSRYGRSAISSARIALAAHGRSFAPAFALFGAWNTKPNGSYGDRRYFPATGYGMTKAMRRVGSDSGWRGIRINHLANADARFLPASTLPRRVRLLINVNGPARGNSPVALVQLRMRSGGVRYVYIPLNGAGDGTRSVLFNRSLVSQVIVTLTNASWGANGKPFLIRARVIRG